MPCRGGIRSPLGDVRGVLMCGHRPAIPGVAGQVIGEDLVGAGGDAIECGRRDQCRVVLVAVQLGDHGGVHIADVQGGHGDVAGCELVPRRVGLGHSARKLSQRLGR